MILLFVEWPEQVEYLLKENKNLAEFSLVAVNITVAHYMIEHKIPYIEIDKYLDYSRFLEETSKGYEQLERICNDLDDILHQHYSSLKEKNIYPFFFNYYYLKIWSDQLKWIFDCISGFVINLEPEQFLYFSDDRYLDNDKQFWSITYPLISKVLESNFNHIHKKPIIFDYTQIQSFESIKDQFSRNVKKHINPSFFNRGIRRVVFEWRKYISRSYKHTYFSISSWLPSEVARKLKLRKIELDFINIPSNVAINKKIQDIIYNALHGRDVICIEVLWPKIKKHILNKVDYFIDIYERADIALKKYDPEFLEMVCGANPEAKIISALLRNYSKKVLILQHGALGQHIEKMYKYIDLSVATDYFVYGESVRDYIYKQYRCTSINVSTVGNNKKINFKSRKNILCAVLGFDVEKPLFVYQICGVSGNLYHNMFNSDGDFNEYNRLRSLVDLFKKNKDMQLILKGHPNTECQEHPMLKALSDHEYSNIQVLKDIPLSEVVSGVDVFLTDRPSTGMLESMLCNKIIIAYNPVIKFWGNDRLLEDSIYFFRDYDDFLGFIESRTYLDSQDNKNYQKYVEQFCGKQIVNDELELSLKRLIN